MKAILVAESRQGTLLPGSYETLAFAEKIVAEPVMFLVGSQASLPAFPGRLYLADADVAGEYNPEEHLRLLQEVVAKEAPQIIVFLHSSYGWDLAPRLAFALGAGQVSEVVDCQEGAMVVPACNSKLRRVVRSSGDVTVVTLQAGAFSLANEPGGSPQVELLESRHDGQVEFLAYEAGELGGVDLSKAEIVVSAGRGIGKPENLAMVEALAKALGGEYGASRPVVDAGWAEHTRQVGSTGQTVSPKLYVACGISGAIQHLAGMKKSEFVVAINTDRDAPIGEVADVLVVADLKQFLPALTARLSA
ncbi:MAG: electron transfer flavoprotein subunit alpha/FixB family protein [Desulfuromonas sp.]|nr:MAG: electron transfer flavoprotein subunit alpha/FixB family protein [Desulfuromonas sp.]